MANNNSMASEIMPLGKHKLVLLGDQSVGKSSILNKFVYNVFDEDPHPTVGIDFISKTVECDEGRRVRMQLWDTAGQERFRSLIPNYIRGSSVAVLVFDITSRQTFDNLGQWVADVKKERANETMVVLIGNKTDLVEDRKVTSQEAEEIKNSYDFQIYKEVSAKTGDGLNELFQEIAKLLPNNDMSQLISQSHINPDQNNGRSGNIVLNKEDQQAQMEKKKKKKCC